MIAPVYGALSFGVFEIVRGVCVLKVFIVHANACDIFFVEWYLYFERNWVHGSTTCVDGK
jgi:hypothetical protein